jgi:uncharacterized membrane protein YkvA (DUF1232 family)
MKVKVNFNNTIDLSSAFKQTIMDYLEVSGMRILPRFVDWLATPYSLYLLLRDPNISWRTKLKAGLILAAAAFYILDPIDLIPDVTPVLGWLDDLAIIPVAMALAARVVPEINVAEIRQRARSTSKRIVFWAIAFIAGVALVSISTLGLLIFLAIRARS